MYKEILYILIQRSYLYMANHRSIQILRASSVDSNIENEKLLEGQPFYNEQKNYLTIGKKADSTVSDFPITVRELVGYVSDSDKITNTKTNEYSFKYSNTDNSLKITSPKGIDINSGDSNITIKRNNNPKIVVKESDIELDVNSLTVKPNTDNVATINTSATNGFILKDSNNARKADVEMGGLTISSRDNTQEGFLHTTISEGIVDTTKIKSQQYVPIVTISSSVRKSVINISNLETDDKNLHVAPAGGTITNYVFNSGDSLVGDGTIVASTFKNASESIKISETETKLKKLDIGTNKETVIDGSGNITTNGNITSIGGSIKVTATNGTSLAEIDNAGNITSISGHIISTNGDITATNGVMTAQSFNALSDKRLKENIVEYSPNKSILDLPIYSYNFISDEKKTKKIGCLAQDLKEICPEIVKEDNNGYLSIEENKIVYLLLDEVKKLKKIVDELEAR